MLGPQDVLPVLKVHHFIRALGNIAKGFPDAPVPTPPNYTPPEWVGVFDQVADAVLVSLGAMAGWKIIREAVSALSLVPFTLGGDTEDKSMSSGPLCICPNDSDNRGDDRQIYPDASEPNVDILRSGRVGRLFWVLWSFGA